MKWEEIIATEYCESVRDGTHDTPRQTESGYKLVTGKHIKNGQIVLDDAYYISENDYTAINQRSLVEKWDVLFSMIGTVGEVAVVKSVPAYAIKNVALFKCGGSELKGKWLFYYLQSPQVKSGIIGNLKGSSQQFLSLKQLRNLHILVTEKLKMQRIVDILSAYDDLIENNRKQIKLLEEAAQRLYKEWFVDLRFPGWETTPIVDGLPEGWKQNKFSDVVDIMSGGTPKTENQGYYNGTIPFYTPKDSDGSVFAFVTQKTLTEEGLSSCNSPLYPQNTIIITARGTVGKTTILARPMAMNQSCYALKSDAIGSYGYLFYSLNKEISRLKSMANGGVFDTIIVKTFDNINIIKPTDAVLSSFDLQIVPILENIKVKCMENFKLTSARDALLPKLMSGEIEV